jgi:hypothetical protein
MIIIISFIYMVNIEDKERCDSIESDSVTDRRASQRARSLSADSTSEYTDRFSLDSNINNYRKQRSREEPYRPKPVRENSYLTAMRNSSGECGCVSILHDQVVRDYIIVRLFINCAKYCLKTVANTQFDDDLG